MRASIVGLPLDAVSIVSSFVEWRWRSQPAPAAPPRRSLQLENEQRKVYPTTAQSCNLALQQSTSDRTGASWCSKLSPRSRSGAREADCPIPGVRGQAIVDARHCGTGRRGRSYREGRRGHREGRALTETPWMGWNLIAGCASGFMKFGATALAQRQQGKRAAAPPRVC